MDPAELESALSIPRRIVGFQLDDQADWVARLECGHNQHVRHNPPWFNRPWVVSSDGRDSMLGQTLACQKCATGAPPDSPGVGLIARILDYLAAHPNASDTVDGIHRWWLAESAASPGEVAAALELLAERGHIEKLEQAGRTLFRAARQ